MEWVLLFFVILILFGPRRLPEIARILGRMFEELRRASSEFRDQVMQIEESAAVDVSSDVEEVTAEDEDNVGENGQGEDAKDRGVADADSADG